MIVEFSEVAVAGALAVSACNYVVAVAVAVAVFVPLRRCDCELNATQN